MVVFHCYGIKHPSGSQTLTVNMCHYMRKKRNMFSREDPKANCCRRILV